MGQEHPMPNRRQPTLDFRQFNLSAHAADVVRPSGHTGYRASGSDFKRPELATIQKGNRMKILALLIAATGFAVAGTICRYGQKL